MNLKEESEGNEKKKVKSGGAEGNDGKSLEESQEEGANACGTATQHQNFKSKNFAVQAQRKILGQFSSRRTIRIFMNENLTSLLDLFYQLIKTHTGDKKIGEKFVKNIIKISIKIGVLAQNGVFSAAELESANEIGEKFNKILSSVYRYAEKESCYDRKFLLDSINECEEGIKRLIRPHLTPISVKRVEFVANILRDTTLLDNSFTSGNTQNEIMISILSKTNKALLE